MTHLGRDNDIALVHGRWLRDPRTHVMRWHPAPRPLEPMDVTCPFCAAAPGDDCTSSTGKPSQVVHARRVELVRKDAAGDRGAA